MGSPVSLSHPKPLGKPSSEPCVDFEMANWVGLTGELFRADAATFGPAGNISLWCHVCLPNHQLQIKFQISLTSRDFEHWSSLKLLFSAGLHSRLELKTKIAPMS